MLCLFKFEAHMLIPLILKHTAAFRRQMYNLKPPDRRYVYCIINAKPIFSAQEWTLI